MAVSKQTFIFNSIVGNDFEITLEEGIGTIVKTFQPDTEFDILDSDITYSPDTWLVVRPTGDSPIDSVSGFLINPAVGAGLNFNNDASYGDEFRAEIKSYYGLFNSDLGLISIDVSKIAGVTTIAPFNRLYLTTPENLEDLAQIPVDDPANPESSIDKRDYVIELLKIPFKIPSDYYPDSTFIELGDYVSTIEANVINNDLLTVDLGEIPIPETGNSSDFDGVKLEMFFPFVDSVIDLEPSLVIGKTISSEYLIDCYNGETTVNVYNGSEIPIVSQKTKLGRKIPFRFGRVIVKDFASDSGMMNEFYSVYVRITKPEIVNGFFNNMVSKTGVLMGNSGFVEVEKINLKCEATLNEKMNIISLLQSGVIIK